jgi:hypothetical protein
MMAVSLLLGAAFVVTNYRSSQPDRIAARTVRAVDRYFDEEERRGKGSDR